MNRVVFGNGNRFGLVLGLFACIGVACASPDTDDETGGSPTTSNNNGGNSQNGGSPSQGGSDGSTGGAPTTSNNMNTTVAPPTTTDQMGTTVGNPTTTTGPGCDDLECLTMCFQSGAFGQCGASGCECMMLDGGGGGTGSILDSVGSFATGQGGSMGSFTSSGLSGGFGGDIGFP